MKESQNNSQDFKVPSSKVAKYEVANIPPNAILKKYLAKLTIQLKQNQNLDLNKVVIDKKKQLQQQLGYYSSTLEQDNYQLFQNQIIKGQDTSFTKAIALELNYFEFSDCIYFRETWTGMLWNKKTKKNWKETKEISDEKESSESEAQKIKEPEQKQEKHKKYFQQIYGATLLDELLRFSNLEFFELNIITKSLGIIGAEYIASNLDKLVNVSNLKLDLSEQQIDDEGLQQLTAILESLQNLQILDLGLQYNAISDDGIKDLGKTIKKLTNLKSLTLNLNASLIYQAGVNSLIKSLQKMPNLLTLSLFLGIDHIGGKYIQLLTENLKIMQNLQNLTLYFQIRSFQEIDFQQVFQNFGMMVNLKSLSFNLVYDMMFEFINSFNIDEKDIDKRSIQLKNTLPQLTFLSSLELNLGNTNLGDNGIQNVCEGLSHLTQLKSLKLDLSHSNNKHDCLQHISNVLSKLLQLKELVLILEANQINTSQILNSLLKLSDLKKLSLNLKSCPLSLNQGLELLNLAPLYLSQLKQFEVNLSYQEDIDSTDSPVNQFQFQCCKQARAAIKEITSIQIPNNMEMSSQTLSQLENMREISLNFMTSKLSEAGTQKISDALSKMTQIQQLELNFKQCQFYDAEMKQMSRSLSKLTQLQKFKLNLKESNISNWGFKELGMCLQELTNLKEINLNLQVTRISDFYEFFIYSALSKLTQLEAVNLKLKKDKWTKIGKNSVREKIISVVEETSYEVCYQNENLSNDDVKYMGEALTTLKKLQQLELGLDKMKISDSTYKDLCGYLSKITSLQQISLWIRNAKREEFEITLEKELKANLPHAKIKINKDDYDDKF